MSTDTKIPKGQPRDRILEVASDLFYRQGYRATGINEVIKKSSVAKATFYSHFPTKDDLGAAYLKGLSEYELNYLDDFTAAAKGAVNRYLSVIQSLGPWLIDTEFRGCGFLNMASEVPDYTSPLRRQGTTLYDGIRARVEQLCQELIESDADKYGQLDARELGNDYMVAFAGAVALAEIYHDIWPVEHAISTVQSLIGQ